MRRTRISPPISRTMPAIASAASQALARAMASMLLASCCMMVLLFASDCFQVLVERILGRRHFFDEGIPQVARGLFHLCQQLRRGFGDRHAVRLDGVLCFDVGIQRGLPE